MNFLRLAEVVGRLPLLYFAVYVPVIGLCVVLQTYSFFRLGSKSLSMPVVCLHAALLLGSMPPMSAIMDSLQGFHKSGCF
jgi:hypothetical protein